MIGAALAGFQLMLGLILSIGPQNAFVLRQGLTRSHVPAIVLFCAASDAVLMGAGIAGLAASRTMFPGLDAVLGWCGAAFLSWYAVRSFRAAVAGSAGLRPESAGKGNLAGTLAAIAVVTWLNPHVLLDTVVLFGSVAAGYPGREVAFWAGGSAASALFFSLLGFGARFLAPVFARPVAWRVLDAAVGAMMLTLAIRVARAQIA